MKPFAKVVTFSLVTGLCVPCVRSRVFFLRSALTFIRQESSSMSWIFSQAAGISSNPCFFKMSGKADGESVLAGLLGDADAEREVIAAVVGAGVETRINPAKMAA